MVGERLRLECKMHGVVSTRSKEQRNLQKAMACKRGYTYVYEVSALEFAKV